MADTLPRVAVFVSGGGSNLQSLIDAVKAGILTAEIALVISSTKKAFGLQRAEKAGIPGRTMRPGRDESPEEYEARMLALLDEHKIDYIALAGYLKLLPLGVVRKYRHRITNIHPALLPKFGGQGMYGHHVHEAVLAAGEKESGPTVHLVDEIYDHGRILEQIRVPVKPDDTPDSLAARVLEKEHRLYPRVLQKLIKGEYDLD
ncbi:MAG TPA: phosphoribosylglycinamide formyltransferase [candidate division Zixibacteria bacterium]|nr:phosphoribosylglycinamide formyltransferase [candidate division Zixibacteria bacterium]